MTASGDCKSWMSVRVLAALLVLAAFLGPAFPAAETPMWAINGPVRGIPAIVDGLLVVAAGIVLSGGLLGAMLLAFQNMRRFSHGSPADGRGGPYSAKR